MHIGVVAEGFGDVAALPALIGKINSVMELDLHVRRVVRSGEWLKLRQIGQLERYVRLAASGDDVDLVIVVCDLDDDCPVVESIRAKERLESLAVLLGIPIRLCFCIREYEAWFLEDLSSVVAASPDVTWQTEVYDNGHAVRDAKGEFSRALGSKYRESVDQVKFSKRLDARNLYGNSRSFRKFVKTISGMEYDGIASLLLT